MGRDTPPSPLPWAQKLGEGGKEGKDFYIFKTTIF